MSQDQSSAEIEREIEHTRSDISHTLDALQQRLSIGGLVEETIGREQISQMLRSAGTGTADFAIGLGRTLRDHPLPVVLTGVGLTWLALSSGRRASSGEHASAHAEPASASHEPIYRRSEAVYRKDPSRPPVYASDPAEAVQPSAGLHAKVEEAGDFDHSRDDRPQDDRSERGGTERAGVGARIGRMTERAGEGFDRAGRGVGKASRTVSGSVSRVASVVAGSSGAAYRTTRDASRWATERAGGTIRSTGRFIQDNPIAAGAIAIGIGAVLAMMLPSSRREHELLGEASDEVKAKVRGTIGEQVDKAKEVAGAAANAAVQAAREKAEAEGIRVEPQPESRSEPTPGPSTSPPDQSATPSAADTIPASAREGGRAGARAHVEVSVSQPRGRTGKEATMTPDPDAVVAVDVPGQQPDKARREKA